MEIKDISTLISVTKSATTNQFYYSFSYKTDENKSVNDFAAQVNKLSEDKKSYTNVGNAAKINAYFTFTLNESLTGEELQTVVNEVKQLFIQITAE